MRAKEIILRNFPHNDLYDDSSFLGKLHEEKLWDIKEYWLLEWGIYNLKKSASESFDWEVFRIFSIIMQYFSCHFDKNDYFRIKNLKRPKIYELKERIQLVFEGYFSKTLPDQNIFEEVNPLLKTS